MIRTSIFTLDFCMFEETNVGKSANPIRHVVLHEAYILEMFVAEVFSVPAGRNHPWDSHPWGCCILHSSSAVTCGWSWTPLTNC